MNADGRHASTGRRNRRSRAHTGMPAALIVGALLVAPTPEVAEAWEGASDSRITMIDVDGDGRADTVRSSMGEGGLYIGVDTAAGRTVNVTLRDGERWAGAASIDGRPGAELVVDLYSSGDSGYQRVLTWRAGKLVVSPVPVSVCGSRDWCTGDPDNGLMGYSLTTVRGVRHLVVTQGRWRGSVALRTTFRWSGGRWKAVATRRVRLSPSAERKAAGWRGVVLHRGTAEGVPADTRAR